MKKIDIKQIQAIETEMLKETAKIFKDNGIVFYMAYGSALGTVRHHGPIPWDADTDILVPVNQLDKAVGCLKSELPDYFRIHSLETDKNYKLIFPRVALPNSSSDQIHVDIFPLLGLPDDPKKQMAISNKLDKRASIFLRNKHFSQFVMHPSFIKTCIAKFIEIFCPIYTKKQLLKQYYKIANKHPFETANYVTSAGACYGSKNIMEKSIYGTPVMMDYCGFSVPLPEQWEFYLTKYYKEYMNFPPESEQKKGLSFETDIADEDYEKLRDVIE